MSTTILDLPDDLLSQVLSFATEAARRDNHPPPPAALTSFRLSLVSASFRRAFFSHLSSISLGPPLATRLADHQWAPLLACRSLRRLAVPPNSGLPDAHLISLLHKLAAAGINLRQVQLSFSQHLTPDVLCVLAAHFGPHLTHLDLHGPQLPRVRRRRPGDPPVIYHPAWQANSPHVPDVVHHVTHVEPLIPQTGPNHVQLHHPPPPAPFVQPPHPNNAHGHAHAHAHDGLPVIHVFAGVPPQQHGVANLDNIMAQDGGPPPPQLAPHLAPVQHAQQPNPAAQPHLGLADQNDDMMEVVDNVLELDVPNFEEAFADMLHDIQADQPVPHLPALPHAQQQPLVPPHYFVSPPPVVTPKFTVLDDEELARLLSKLPNLIEFRLTRAKHVRGLGILALTQCPRLEVLVLVGSMAIKNQTLFTVLTALTKLRVLHLIEMPMIGDPVVSAICTGPSRSSIEELRLTKIGRVTDPAVKQLVNSCERLEHVHIADCPRITSNASSHLSCSLQMKKIFFKPGYLRSVTNRTSRHFSCASATLRSLKLVGCRDLTLDGIVALGNLPGLRQLHMSGLQQVSQDVMRQLGIFPKLDDILLQGSMSLTDLGVKVLCGQRGHRYLHLALLDTTRNLTDEALECVMTWCRSLRTLRIYGCFKTGAFNRLHECIPNASLIVDSEFGQKRIIRGKGGLWDRPMEAP